MKSKALARAVGKIKRVLSQKEMGEKDLAKAIGIGDPDGIPLQRTG